MLSATGRRRLLVAGGFGLVTIMAQAPIAATTTTTHTASRAWSRVFLMT